MLGDIRSRHVSKVDGMAVLIAMMATATDAENVAKGTRADVLKTCRRGSVPAPPPRLAVVQPCSVVWLPFSFIWLRVTVAVRQAKVCGGRG